MARLQTIAKIEIAGVRSRSEVINKVWKHITERERVEDWLRSFTKCNRVEILITAEERFS